MKKKDITFLCQIWTYVFQVRKIQEDDSTVRVQKDKSPNIRDVSPEVHIDSQEKSENMENDVRKPHVGEMDAQPLRTVSRDITHQKVVTQKENLHELNVIQKKNAPTNSFVTKQRNIAHNSNTVSKPSFQGPKQSVSGRTLSAQNKRPGSGTGKKKVVPAHISAPFQTNPNLKTSKLQSTYRSATTSKPSLRAQANASSAKVRTGVVNRSVKGSHSASTKTEQVKFSHEKSDISVRSTSHDSKAHCDKDDEAVSVTDVKSKQNDLNFRESAEKDRLNLNANCDDKTSSSILHETGQSTAMIDKISGGMNDAEQSNSEDETEKLFHLKRDG